ncbi:MAG: hypothetical protein ABSC63_21405 [Candidatus Binataceae bacterium]
MAIVGRQSDASVTRDQRELVCQWHRIDQRAVAAHILCGSSLGLALRLVERPIERQIVDTEFRIRVFSQPFDLLDGPALRKESIEPHLFVRIHPRFPRLETDVLDSRVPGPEEFLQSREGAYRFRSFR